MLSEYMGFMGSMQSPSRLQAAFLVSIFAISILAPALMPVAEAPGTATLAETLNAVINNVDWANGDSWTSNWAMILGDRGASAYDQAIVADVARGGYGYIDALYVARLAELSGYSSETIANATKSALEQIEMSGGLLINYWPDTDGDFLLYDRFALWGYTYAEQSNLTSKWNVTQAFNDFARIYDRSGVMLQCDPRDNYAFGSSRYYDEHAETLSVFLRFFEQGVPEALGYADDVWNKVQPEHWNTRYGFYGYRDTAGIECEMGNFAQVIAEYKSLKGGTIPYWNRVIQDLNYTLLANGWSSPGWSSPGVIVHATWNPERRMWETLGATMALQGVFPDFTSGMKSAWADMLRGARPAWEGLVASDLNQNGHFKGTSSSTTSSNDATVCAAATMFLYGIVPVTGSLAIPAMEESYPHKTPPIAASSFKFDYADRIIRIPVRAGQMTFIYGTTPVNCTFPSDGVYTLKFSDDWNRILTVNDKPVDKEAYLQMVSDPMQDIYLGGQAMNFTATVFNGLNTTFESTLALNITGPDGYYHHDSRPVAVAAGEIQDYIFSWVVPDDVGMYVVGVDLVSAQLIGHDAIFLDVENPLPSPSPSLTPTPTPYATPTPTPSPTLTPSPSPTPKPSPTPSPITTPKPSPTITVTPTPTPTATPSKLPTEIPASPTPTPSPEQASTIGVLPPEAFYAAVIIGVGAIIAIATIVQKKNKK
jgi:hypothetical protein